MYKQKWVIHQVVFECILPSRRKFSQHQNIDCKRCLSLRCGVSYVPVSYLCVPLQWRHFDHDGVSNHQPHGCLLNRLFRRRSKKTLKLRATGLCVGNSPGPVNSPHKGPVTRKMFPFDDVIMQYSWHCLLSPFKSSVHPVIASNVSCTNPVFIMTTMMTSSNGNIFRVTGHLCGEFTGPRWIPRKKTSDAELWCFLWSWVNNHGAGDLRRYCAYYDVIVMTSKDLC